MKLTVAISLAIGSLSYLSGSSPEAAVLKACAGLLGAGLLGWLMSALLASALARSQTQARLTGAPEAAPATQPDAAQPGE